MHPPNRALAFVACWTLIVGSFSLVLIRSALKIKVNALLILLCLTISYACPASAVYRVGCAIVRPHLTHAHGLPGVGLRGCWSLIEVSKVSLPLLRSCSPMPLRTCQVANEKALPTLLNAARPGSFLKLIMFRRHEWDSLGQVCVRWGE